MPSVVAQPAELKGGGGAKRSEAAIQRRRHKAKARSKVKKLRAEGATVPKALALAVRPAKHGLPRRDQTNGFAAKLLAAGQAAPAEATTGAATSGTAAALHRVSAGSPSATAAPIDNWCRRGALVRCINRRVGEVLGDPDSECEVKLKWLDDGQESGFVHCSQLEYVAADVEEYVDDGEGPVRKPHKKAARKAARESAAAAAAAAHTVGTPLDAPLAAEARVEAGVASVAGVAAAQSTAEGGAEKERAKSNHRKRRKKDKSTSKEKK